jgi:hypothetical protein
MEWLAANWLWVVLGFGAALLFFRGGMACGMGQHGSHGAHESHRPKSADSTQNGHTTNGQATEEGRETEETGSGARRRHRGC